MDVGAVAEVVNIILIKPSKNRQSTSYFLMAANAVAILTLEAFWLALMLA